ncbi:hypothetical protein [Paenibacillus taiwanensis]|uniref:hypothetical protein n=1 Tax=Paenibacillus taiwanensis TaxID=401638 RepID=UPI0004277F1F|nr:hypothetical protein [Paenibacillus taiwanensis]
MFIKIYRYYVQPSQLNKCLTIVDRSDQIYKTVVDYTMLHVRCEEEPTKFVEIQMYENEQVYEAAMDILNRNVELESLYQQFMAILDPQRPKVYEETCKRLTEHMIIGGD